MHNEARDRYHLVKHWNHLIQEWDSLNLALISYSDEKAEERLAFKQVVTMAEMIHLFLLLSRCERLTLCIYHYRSTLSGSCLHELIARSILQACTTSTILICQSTLRLVNDLGHVNSPPQ